MCMHQPPCPPATAIDHDAARLVAFHPEQGWGLLCNGVVVFDDSGELFPDGHAVGTQPQPTCAGTTTGRSPSDRLTDSRPRAGPSPAQSPPSR